MIMISLYAVTKGGNDTMIFQFTLENFAKFLKDPVFMRVLVTSLRIAFLTNSLPMVGPTSSLRSI